MQKITLKLLEFYQLEIELNGFIDNEGKTIINGLLNENLPLTTKYWLNQLYRIVLNEKTEIDKVKNELIHKYGEQDENGNISILKLLKDGNNNPYWVNFQIEWSNLLQEEKEVEYKSIKLNDLANITSSNNYSSLFKFVSAD